MAQIQSKLSPIYVDCVNYAHPWTDSCLDATCGVYIHATLYCLRMYATVYLLSLATKGKLPNKNEVIKTIYGILQSTAFLSGAAFGFSAVVCCLRKILGSYNFYTAAFVPSFISSIFAILIERPHRRSLLALYVTNNATETSWNMLLSRNIVKDVKYGNVAIFAVSVSLLLLYFKKGWHKKDEKSQVDSIFSIIRFIMGPHEEKSIASRNYNMSRQDIQNDPSPRRVSSSWCSRSSKNSVYVIVIQALRVYKRLIEKIKCCDRHFACPHPFSCLYYTLQGTGKMFGLGLGLQICLKALLNIKSVFSSPKSFKSVIIKKSNLNLAVFLGGFSGLFRAILCTLRRATGKDDALYALPAGLIAGTAFAKYPDNSVALYVMWKTLQVTYNIGAEQGVLPEIPGFVEFLYCLSTATLFHVALFEPTTLRPSYWKFLHGVSGGRIACMSRPPLDVWGLKSSESIVKVLKATKTLAVVS